MADTIEVRLRGLNLSGIELREMHPNWSEAMIDDYLNFFNNFAIITVAIDNIISPVDTNIVSRSYFYGRVY